ncbi:Hypothetical protein A7982_01869 [Minicystis rosea]|nr:Hypothetical protein A7982_01869 [Minicystis rosea]
MGGGYFAGRNAGHHERAPRAAATVRAEDDGDLSARIATLEAEVSRLQQQRRSAPPPRAAAEAPAATGEPARARPLVDDPVFESGVRDVLDRIQQERAGEREDRRTQAQQRWADRLTEQAGLSDQQKAKVLGIAQDLAEKMRGLRDPDAGASSPEGFRAQRDAFRAESEQRLAEVLSPKQMEIYRGSSDLRIEAGWGRGGRGRGGP